ncbi:SDR family NAD(P)-dependent oxidoreductase [Streptomyces sp. NBC_00445]|uniref:SDR family NAD(P)-dependent oxidoreductase n=1 Tax=unclassified Streptomyces TaxID=2593676 RepID=UPI002E1AFDEC|nr:MULTISPECIES: SDR family NAD(P)-dependent oxidoreductase [unclassified Streptomyces]
MGIRDGKVAIITGGAKGIGEAHVRRFVEKGAKVVVADLDLASGEKLAIGLGDDAIFVELDVTDTSGWEAVIQQTKAALATVDILVNNAGTGEQLLALLDGKGLGDITVEGEALLLDALLSVVEKADPRFAIVIP